MLATSSRSAFAGLRLASTSARAAQRSLHSAARSTASTSQLTFSVYRTSQQSSAITRASQAASSVSTRAFSSSRLARNDTSTASAGTGEGQMSSGEQEIYELLTKRFKPALLQVTDVSGGCGSFYSIQVASTEFQGLTTVKQHRLVNECLKDIIGNIHGLQLRTAAA